MKTTQLHKTPKELFKFKFFENIRYSITLFFIEKTGLWKRPIRAHGDLENMTFKDLAYWLYKTTNPTTLARKGSNLEKYFQEKMQQKCALPTNFTKEKEITISSAGDLLGHNYLENSPDIYEKIGYLIFDSDIPMANLECTIFDGNKKFEFNTEVGPPLYYSAKQFNIVKGNKTKKYRFMSTACNHSLDFGEDGLQATINVLENNNILFNGINKKEEDYFKATIIEQKGFKIGVIAHTFGLNAHPIPQNRPQIVNYTNINDPVEQVDYSQIESQIHFCKQENVDFIIAHLHWGMEHEFYPTPEQIDVAHHLAEMGIDTIIGHHPHVIQPYEFYQTKRDPNRFVPVYYSLGNLINSFSAEYLCLSYVANLKLAKGYLDDNKTAVVYVESSQCHKIRQTVDLQNQKVILKPEDTP